MLEVYEAYIKKVKKYYENNSDKLIEVLDPDYPYIIYHTSVMLSDSKEGGPEFKPEDWKWLASVLVDAVKKEPKIVLPQIVVWIFDEISDTWVIKYSLNDERAANLFGNDLIDIMKLISKFDDFNNFEKREQNLITFAKKIAIEKLRKEDA